MQIITILKRLAYACSNPERMRFYKGLLQPRDDYFLRYFGHQYGILSPVPLDAVFPNIDDQSICINYLSALVTGTSLSVEELVILIAITKEVGINKFCEIGTFNGVTAANVAENNSESANDRPTKKPVCFRALKVRTLMLPTANRLACILIFLRALTGFDRCGLTPIPLNGRRLGGHLMLFL